MTETNTHHYASIKNMHGNLLNTTETKSVVLRFLCNTANCFNNRLKYNFELSAVIREKKRQKLLYCKQNNVFYY